MQDNFIDLYLEYSYKTECPVFFNRWTAISCLAAYLGRSISFKHGHFTLHPNLYTMLIGSPGTKKSSAIKIGVKLLKQAGYTTFAAKKTRQEKFLQDMSELDGYGLDTGEASILETNIFGDSDICHENREPAECFIAADEFNNFIGVGNMQFASILGELWDYEGIYDYKLKNSKNIVIPEPTVSILGGNTPTGFSQAFPPECIDQGFFSRLLLVYGEPSGVKYTFPPPPNLVLQEKLVALLHKTKEVMRGEIKLTDKAMELVDEIYHSWKEIDDIRFHHYSNRRLTHLLKLCLTIAASRLSMTIGEVDVIYANTMLSFTEQLMPKALGEFGKARHSDVTHKVMTALDNTNVPLSIAEIWKWAISDLENRNQLIEIMGNLQVAGKIQTVEGGFLPIKKVLATNNTNLVNWNLLTDSERGLL